MNKYGYVINVGRSSRIKGIVFADSIYDAEKHLKDSYADIYPYGGFNLYEL